MYLQLMFVPSRSVPYFKLYPLSISKELTFLSLPHHPMYHDCRIQSPVIFYLTEHCAPNSTSFRLNAMFQSITPLLHAIWLRNQISRSYAIRLILFMSTFPKGRLMVQRLPLPAVKFLKRTIFSTHVT